MPSERLFAGTYERGAAAAQVDGRAWLQAMLDVEAALARAGAREGVIASAAAEAIVKCCRAEHFDLAAIAQAGADDASVVIALVRALRAAVGSEHADAVHRGATSQDILDTAAMLVARRALEPILSDAAASADIAAGLAERHRHTVMCGRTLLQQALPTTFGLKSAQWLTGLDEARARLQEVDARELAVQLGGPVGTGSPRLTAALAAELSLAAPPLSWHTMRGRLVTLAAGLGTLSGTLGKIARDVTLLAQNEVGEVREAGGSRGGSSTMAHKQNPVAAVSVLACTKRVPGFVATMFAAMEQEHERAAGAWQAEWATLSDLLQLTSSAAAWAREMLERLEVDPERMRENLARLAAAGVPEAQAPEDHLGSAGELIDHALAAHRIAGAARDDAHRP